MKKKVEIFSTPSCHYCHLAKDFFSHHKNEFFEIVDYDVTKDLLRRQELIDLGAMGVPLIRLTGGAKTLIINGFGPDEEDQMSEYLGIGKYKTGMVA